MQLFILTFDLFFINRSSFNLFAVIHHMHHFVFICLISFSFLICVGPSSFCFLFSPFSFPSLVCGAVCVMPRDPTETYPRICVLCTGPASGSNCRQSGIWTPSAATRHSIRRERSSWTTLNQPSQKLVTGVAKYTLCHCLPHDFEEHGAHFKVKCISLSLIH